MKRFVIAVYVENKYGVLARVTGMFMRKGFNIDSLTVGATENPEYSRITITLNGDDYAREQLINQLKKLFNVKIVKLLETETTVERELLLIKVKNTTKNRDEIINTADKCSAKIIDNTTDTICVEVTGEPITIDAFIQKMKPLGIVEMCRTGVVALESSRNIMDK